MRICLITPDYPDENDPGKGLPGYYPLSNIGDPTLTILRRRKGAPTPAPDNVRLARIPFPDAAISNRSGFFRLLALLLKVSGYLVFWLLSLPLLLWFRPHIVHIQTPMPILQGLFAKYLLRSRLFITFIGSDMHHLPRWWLLRALVRRADMVCYVSTSMRPVLEQTVPPERLLYTPMGVDTVAFPPGGETRAPTALMVGSLRWQKGYADALSAFAIFQRQHADWRMNIVGAGPQLGELEAQVRRLGLDGSVSLLGMKSRDEVAALMRANRVFILSSVSEGFPRVLLEAAASGLPMVVTDVGSCREIAENGIGLVAPPGDPEALAEALQKLVADETMWRRFSEKGPDIARRSGWENTAEIVYAAYQNSLDR